MLMHGCGRVVSQSEAVTCTATTTVIIRGQGQGWGPLFLPCSRVKTSQLNTIQPRQHTYILPQPSASSEELLLRLLQTMLKAPVVAARFRDLCCVELLDTSVVAQIFSVEVLAFKPH